MIDEVLQKMRAHTIENPTHGINCSCKDPLLAQARGWLRTNLAFDELRYLARVVSSEPNVSCTECYDAKQYWTEWSDSAMRDPQLMSLVIELPTDEPLALIHCSSCSAKLLTIHLHTDDGSPPYQGYKPVQTRDWSVEGELAYNTFPISFPPSQDEKVSRISHVTVTDGETNLATIHISPSLHIVKGITPTFERDCLRFPPPEPAHCDHHDNCGGNHTTRTSDFWCDHDQHCDLEHG